MLSPSRTRTSFFTTVASTIFRTGCRSEERSVIAIKKSIIIPPMRYAMFSTSDNRTARLGVLRFDRMIDIRAHFEDSSDAIPASVLALVDAGPDIWARVAVLV